MNNDLRGEVTNICAGYSVYALFAEHTTGVASQAVKSVNLVTDANLTGTVKSTKVASDHPEH